MAEISVIIPTYNRLEVLPRAIESVLNQTYRNFELIVVDDGSTDGTRQRYEDDPRIIYLLRENGGVSAARNSGIEIATGTYIAFLDSDDEWLPRKLEYQIALFKGAPELGFVHTEEIWIRDGVRVNQMKKHRKYGGWLYQRSLPLCVISPSTVMMLKEIFERHGGFDEEYVAGEDYDLWLRITPYYEGGFIEEPLIKKYGGHDDQLSKLWGIDAYRVRSMEKMIIEHQLDQSDRAATLKLLIKKLKILIKGYTKHNRLEQVASFQQKLTYYQNMIQE